MTTSHRQVFRSSAIIGGSSVINMAISIAKVKILAVLLGPAGIGLMGLYQNLIAVTSKLAGGGLDSSGVRQVAAVADDAALLPVVRRALWLANLMLGASGMCILWLLREPISHWVFGGSAHGSDVGWLGLGLLLTLLAGSQTALLQGLRRIGDMAMVSILSALVAAGIGSIAVYLLGNDGVLWFVLSAPAVNFLVAHYYVARLPDPRTPYDLATLHPQWLIMLRLGIPLMAAGLLMLITQLAVRSMVLHELGLEASGYFQAAWAISMTYVGFVLNAMAMDYFPRLTTAINDHERASKLVNEQTEMALLFVGPALLGVITLAPWLIQLLYSQEFGPAAEILRWQVLGDIFKVASVPMVFIFLAKGHGGIAVGIQFLWSAIYTGMLIFGIDEYGLVMTGVGFVAAYLLYYVVVAILANRLIGFKLSQRNWVFTLMLSACAASILFFTTQSAATAYIIGLLATLLFSLYSLRRLDHLIDLSGWLRQKFRQV